MCTRATPPRQGALAGGCATRCTVNAIGKQVIKVTQDFVVQQIQASLNQDVGVADHSCSASTARTGVCGRSRC
jgi:hypothetical protein